MSDTTDSTMVPGADGCDQFVDDGRDEDPFDAQRHRAGGCVYHGRDHLTEGNQENVNGQSVARVPLTKMITDVFKIKEMVIRGELLFSVINVNGYKMKFKFDNVFGCRSGARVFATECDHICALQAGMEHTQNNMTD